MTIKHFATYVAGGTAAAAAAAMLTVAPANAEGTFAAIAYSPATEVHGWTIYGVSPQEARWKAVLICQSHGGTDCTDVAVSTAAEPCVALAENETHFAGARGVNIATAEHNAAVQLGGGIAQITVSECVA